LAIVKLLAIVKEIIMNIYVGNLADEVDEHDLCKVFEVFGQVESVNILKDRFSGKSRGFGFLKMPSRDEAQAAIKETNGTDLKGTAIRVNEAHPRRGGGSGDRRGGGRGGRRSY
jgi:RNA recognition motif-containing protein